MRLCFLWLEVEVGRDWSPGEGLVVPGNLGLANMLWDLMNLLFESVWAPMALGSSCLPASGHLG